jgi:hypothetical protein
MAPGVKPMTEAEWLSGTDPTLMLHFLRDSSRLTERKARLFGVRGSYRSP